MQVRRSHAHYALGVLTVTYVFNFVDRQLLAILVEPIKTEVGVSDTAMGFLYGFAFALFYATLAIPVAALADRSVRRNILAYAAGIWSIMTVLCGLAGTFWQLLTVRIGVAVGIVQALVAPGQRTLACAVLLLFMNLIGFGLGPVLIGIFSDWLEPTFGVLSIRYALLIGMVTYVAAIGCYFAASRGYNDQRYEHRAGSAEAEEC